MSNIEKWLEQLLTYREFPLEKEKEEIKKKVDEIEKLAENIEERELEDDFHEQNLSYAELCWLNGELDIIIKKFFDKE